MASGLGVYQIADAEPRRDAVRPDPPTPARGGCARLRPVMRAAVCATLIAGSAVADKGETLTIELNKLEGIEAGCQAYMVVESGLAEPLGTLSLDVVTFDGDGVIGRRLAVELGPVEAGRMSVKAFVVEATACGAIARMLVNGVLACAGDAGPREDCAALIETRSRSSTPLVQ